MTQSQAPYSLGYVALKHFYFQSKTIILQVSLVLKKAKPKRIEQRGIRTTILLIESQTPYPLSYVAIKL